MKFPRRSPTPRWFARAAAGVMSITASDRLAATPWLSPASLPPREQDASARLGFAYEGVLGTSMDVMLHAAPARDARECEHRMLAEIGRLENVLSLYRPDSEIARVAAGGQVESPELAELLRAYDRWSARTGGALSANLGGVRALWREAAPTGVEPDAAALAAAFATPRSLNVDALGKAFIVDRVAALGREFAPAGLVDIGGDLRAWGDATWMVGVAHPLDAADNASPLVRFPLRDAAVATSGSYARPLSIGGRRMSHLIDPRTLRPADFGISATVVATDCVTANALATAACVLGATDGAQLARTYGLDHLIATAAEGAATGEFAVNGAGAGATTTRPTASATATEMISADAWPAGFEVAINVALRMSEGFRVKRPYVAVWIEDSQHKPVRTLTVWGNGRYQPDLSKWWRTIAGNRSTARAVTRATRQPGSYTVTWDGRDDEGTPVPQGDYTIFVEINREHGHHVWEGATVSCRREPGEAKLRATAESDASSIEYGPKSGG